MPLPPRSTDDPFLKSPPPTGLTIAEMCKQSAASIHCGYCTARFRDDPQGHKEYQVHLCRDPAGRNMAPVKERAAEGARRALKALKSFPVPNCILCDAPMSSGVNHACAGRPANQPHDANTAAAAWQRAGMVKELAREIDEMNQKGQP